MNGMAMLQQEYQPGMRVVAGRGRRLGLRGLASWTEMRVETVESVDDEAVRRGYNARMVLRHGDEKRTVLLCRTGINDTEIEATPWTTLWTEPLPADDDVAIKMVAAALAPERLHSTLLLWIGVAMESGLAYAHPLLGRSQADGDERRYVPTDGMGYSPYPIIVQSMGSLEPRSLIAAQLGQAHEKEGLTIHSIEGGRTLLRDVGLHEAASTIPQSPRRQGHYARENFAGWYDIAENEERAHAMTEPSESLVLCWSDGDRQEVKCLAQTGIDFWRNDDPESYAEGSVPGPGLWLWHDVQYRGYHDHEGVYDAYMEGRWSPASEQDVIRLTGSLSAAEDDIREYASLEGGGLLQEYMRMARSISEAETPQPATV